MIEYEDWIFEELKKYKKANQLNPFFLSDWNSDNEFTFFPPYSFFKLEKDDYSEFSYKFSEDLIWVKECLKSKYPVSKKDWSLNNYSIGINSTNSIYLSIRSLIEQGKNRFLIITPIYYSIIDTLNDFKKNITFYHLIDKERFLIDFKVLENIVKQQYIDCIIMSDPIYCAGIGLTKNDYEEFAIISKRNKVTLLFDNTLSGLDWDEKKNQWNTINKLEILSESYNFIMVWSESKMLFLNDLKFSTIVGSERSIYLIEDLASQISGGLNKIHIKMFKSVHDTNEKVLEACKNRNLETIKANYNLLKASIQGMDFSLYPSNTGYFTMLTWNEKYLNDIDPKEVTRNFLYNYNFLILLGTYFSFYKTNRLSFRINLIKNYKMELPRLLEALKHNV